MKHLTEKMNEVFRFNTVNCKELIDSILIDRHFWNLSQRDIETLLDASNALMKAVAVTLESESIETESQDRKKYGSNRV